MTHTAVRGMLWTAWGKGAQAALQLAVIAVLARLVAPSDFGIVSAAMIVIGFSAIFSRVGLGPALVQRKTLEERHVATAYVVSPLFGVIVGAIIWIGAPAFAGLLHIEATTPILRALAWAFPIKGIGVIGEALLEREMRFRWLANLEVISFGVGYGMVGVGTAWLGWGAWSLVAANLGEAVVKSGVLLVARRPPARLYIERVAFRELIHFGGGFTAGRYFNYLALQGDNLVVGRFLGPVALGLYGRAYQLMANPAALFGEVLDKVLFPAMARVQDDPARLHIVYRRGITLIGLVMLPTSAALYILAPEVIGLALGDHWLAVVPPFQVFAIGMLFRTSYKMSDAIARATGNVYRRALRQVAYAAFVVGGAIVGQRWGIEGVAIAVLVALLANFLIMAQLSLRVTQMTWAQFAGAHSAPVALTTLVIAVLLPATMLLRGAGASTVTLLIVGCAASLGAVIVAARLLPAVFLGPDGVWMLKLLQSYLPSRRPIAAPPKSPRDVSVVG